VITSNGSPELPKKKRKKLVSIKLYGKRLEIYSEPSEQHPELPIRVFAILNGLLSPW
jgi:hypothetical protein